MTTAHPSGGLSILRDQGPRRFLGWLYGGFLLGLNSLFSRIRPLMTFRCGERKYHYFCHAYNGAANNERTVEVPLVREVLRAARGRRVLEVGNVLSWYGPIVHTVVDKYEQASGVLNVDIVDYHPPERYDLIISISTIEHIGFDETPRDPAKIAHAVAHLKSLLAPGGRLITTFPLAYNPNADRFWLEDTRLFTEKYCLRKISRFGFWKEVPLPEIREPRYGAPYAGGNWVAVGIISNPG